MVTNEDHQIEWNKYVAIDNRINRAWSPAIRFWTGGPDDLDDEDGTETGFNRPTRRESPNSHQNAESRQRAGNFWGHKATPKSSPWSARANTTC